MDLKTIFEIFLGLRITSVTIDTKSDENYVIVKVVGYNCLLSPLYRSCRDSNEWEMQVLDDSDNLVWVAAIF